MYQPNEKIVCVNNSIPRNKREQLQKFSHPLVEGETYTVREVTTSPKGAPMILLKEIKGDTIEAEGKTFELGFNPSRFKSLSEIQEEAAALEAANAELQLLGQPRSATL